MEEVQFRPLEHTRLSDFAVRQIRDLITSGKLKPGAQLPPERELVDQLAVSRSSVREALRLLEGMGLLEVRPGLGTFVAGDLDAKFQSLLRSWLLEYKEKIVDLLEAREALEVRAGLLAVRRITEAELEEMERAVREMDRQVARKNVEGIVVCDRQFHDILCRASRNAFVGTLVASLYDAMDETRSNIYTILPDIRDQLVAEHEAIYEALKARDRAAVEKTITFHMNSLRNDIQRVIDLQGLPVSAN